MTFVEQWETGDGDVVQYAMEGAVLFVQGSIREMTTGGWVYTETVQTWVPQYFNGYPDLKWCFTGAPDIQRIGFALEVRTDEGSRTFNYGFDMETTASAVCQTVGSDMLLSRDGEERRFSIKHPGTINEVLLVEPQPEVYAIGSVLFGGGVTSVIRDGKQEFVSGEAVGGQYYYLGSNSTKTNDVLIALFDTN